MNLLPVIEKRIVAQEYYRRLAVVALVCLSILISISLISVIVSYVASTYEIRNLNREIASATSANITGGVVADMNIVRDVNNKLSILTMKSAQDIGYDVSEIFNSIIKSTTVHLMSFTYDQISIKKGSIKEIGYRITIGGVAKDRETLHNFVKSLEVDKRFLSVDLPISSLIASKDLDFVITLMMDKKK